MKKNEGKAVAASVPETSASITELVFIIDRSGSMCGLEQDTIGGFNATLAKHKTATEKGVGACYVSTVLFDHEQKVIHDRQDIASVAPMTSKDYEVRGCTALLDAIGGAIRHTERVQKILPEGYKADKIIFTIITDGMENASQKYTADKVKRKIGEKQEMGWEFLFLGANIDAVETAGHLGISEDRAVNYCPDAMGVGLAYEAVAKASCAMRESGRSRIGGAWKNKVAEDHAQRGR